MRERAKRTICLLLTALIALTAAAVLADGEAVGAEMNNDITTAVRPDESAGEPENSDAPRESEEKPAEKPAEKPQEPPEEKPSAPEGEPNEAQPLPENTPQEAPHTPEDEPEGEPDDAPSLPENTPQETPPAPEEYVAGENILTENIEVYVDKTTLTPGESTRAHCRVYPEGASKAVKWASSNPGVAKVTHDGVIRILPGANIPESGEYIDIWAKASDGSLVMSLETIYVLPHIKKLKLFMGDTTVRSGDEAPFLSVFVDIQPASLFGRVQITWKSSDPRIAMVAPGGDMGEAARIIWYEPGEVTITAYAASNPNCRDSMRLLVLPAQK